MKEDKIEIEELKTWGYLENRLLDLLNGDYDLEEARQDIKSFRNTKYYTGNNVTHKFFPPNNLIK